MDKRNAALHGERGGGVKSRPKVRKVIFWTAPRLFCFDEEELTRYSARVVEPTLSACGCTVNPDLYYVGY